MLIGFGHAAFGRGDVGAALEEFGGERAGDYGRLSIEWRRRNSEFGGRLADQNGDGVFELGAGYGYVGVLHTRGVELCLGLGHVGLGSYAALEAIECELEGVGVGLDGVVEELLLGVGAAEFEIVDGEFGVKAEAGRSVVGGGGLGFFAGSGYAATNAAPKIDFVGEIDG